jgi:hypothetical protein
LLNLLLKKTVPLSLLNKTSSPITTLAVMIQAQKNYFKELLRQPVICRPISSIKKTS